MLISALSGQHQRRAPSFIAHVNVRSIAVQESREQDTAAVDYGRCPSPNFFARIYLAKPKLFARFAKKAIFLARNAL